MYVLFLYYFLERKLFSSIVRIRPLSSVRIKSREVYRRDHKISTGVTTLCPRMFERPQKKDFRGMT